MQDQHDTSVTEDIRISVAPLTVLGFRADGRPIFPIAGGAEGDPDPAPEPDPEPTPEPEPDDDPEPDEPDPAAAWTPPSKEEWERVKRTMVKRKEEKLAVQKELNALRDQSRTAETEHEKAVREAAERAEARYKPIVVNKAARAALIQAGGLAAVEDDKAKADARMKRLLKLIDLDDLSIDDDGEVLGLDEQIEGLKADYPELFTQPVKPRPKARPTAADRQPAEEKPKSSAERHAMKVLGRTG